MPTAKRGGGLPKPAIARTIAFDILERAAAGGYASELLMERTARLDARDAGLAAEITLGVLRRQGQLDFLIEHYSGRPMRKVEPAAAIALRMAIYQMRFLDRVPPYAAVNDSLNLLRERRKLSAIGFANAVLRKAAEGEARIPEETGAPAWLMEKWTRDFGAEEARGIVRASLRTPKLYQHAPVDAAPPEGGRATEVAGCWEVTQPDPRYRVQDIGSQAIVPLLQLTAGQRFLDLCAAPGNKTAQARERTARVVAADVSLARLRGLRSWGIPLTVLDATAPLPFGRVFDAILVDAPCSGTGTLGHNPEIKWRLTAADLPRFAERQTRILTQALACLAPGGRLVYATCSLEREENEEVARAAAAGRIEREIRRLPGRDPGDGFYAAVIR